MQAAREAAQKAIREADRAEAEAWSVRMEGYGGPAQPSPTIGQMPQRRAGLARGRVQSLQDTGEPAARRDPPAAGYADLEAGGVAKMPVVSERKVGPAGADDQADGGARNHALQVGASGRGKIDHTRLDFEGYANRSVPTAVNFT